MPGERALPDWWPAVGAGAPLAAALRQAGMLYAQQGTGRG